MRSIQLKNFRSFQDTGEIELKPLVILVGTNSSGKSSFLRFFPLLKQTASSASSGPLLWFGQPVDFKDFQNTVCRSRSDEPISISFSLRKLVVSLREWYYMTIRHHAVSIDSLSVSVNITNPNQRSAIQSVSLRIPEIACEMTISHKSVVSRLVINNIDVSSLIDQKSIPRCVSTVLMPIFERDSSAKAAFRTAINSAVASLLADIYHSNTAENTLHTRAERLQFGPREKIQDAIRRAGSVTKFSITPKVIETIQALLFAKMLPALCESALAAFISFSTAVNYIGPFRTDPPRYHRIQELSVKQIGVHGENMAMWLKSLPEKDLSSFSEWAMNNFGFGVDIEQSGGHVELVIAVGTQRYNVIDMGYGISQVLPIVAQCWTDSLKASNTEQQAHDPIRVIAIEQPELHLHPSMQARLADMFVSMIPGIDKDRDGTFPTCLIIETHSEHMLNRFGEMICEHRLNKSNILVLLFDKDEATGITAVHQSQFDEDGILKDWPVGFFIP